jgi:hypothetical protein
MVAQPNYGLSTDTTLGGNSPSDIISPSEKAIKAYVDAHVGDSEIFVAEYGVTTYTDAKAAYDAGKQLVCSRTVSGAIPMTYWYICTSWADGPNIVGDDFTFSAINGTTSYSIKLNSKNGWGSVSTNSLGTVKKVNNTSPDSNGNVTINIPSEVTESTVSGWGFTKNVGTVTSVNNTSPDVNGNVTLDIPDISDYYDKTETDALLDEKQDTITNLNAGYGINIYDYYPDAVIPDYHVMNGSQQYVSYSVADTTAWVSTRLENPMGISITDVLDNVSSKAFEYVALVPYSAGAGIGLKLTNDSDISILEYTDGLFLQPASTETSLTSSLFGIGGAYFKTTNDISITSEQYAQIQQQGGIWFKITSDGAGNYNSYYSFDNSTWVEIIFNDSSRFSPEHYTNITSPCLGAGNKYTSTATYNLEAASFSFTPARDPYIKIGVDESVLPVITDTYSSTSHDGMSGVAVASALSSIAIPTKISDLTDDTATNPIDKADTLTGLTASITELNYVDGVTSAIQTQLDGKQDTLVSGTNIKTINNTSLLGSGNVAVQEVLVSGTNIKTINNESLLGSGNVSTTQVIIRDWA